MPSTDAMRWTNVVTPSFAKNWAEVHWRRTVDRIASWGMTLTRHFGVRKNSRIFATPMYLLVPQTAVAGSMERRT
jgi:hypothetical protein